MREITIPEKAKEYEFTHANIIPVSKGIYIEWTCKGIGFGRIEICRGRVDRETMGNEFIIALFEYLERQENGANI